MNSLDRRRELGRDFDKSFKRATSAFVVVWVFAALLSLAATVVGIWAVVQLVQWLVSK